MRIRLTSITRTNDDVSVASFTCSIGAGRGRWAGTRLPELRDYDVEFNLDKVVAPPRDETVAEPARPTWSTDGTTNLLRGVVEQVDDDGLITVRLAADCLTMVELVSPGSHRPGEIIVIRIAAHDLSIWPIGG